MKTARTTTPLRWALCSALVTLIFTFTSLVPAVAEVDRETGVEGANLPLQAADAEDTASAEATGVGLNEEQQVRETAEVAVIPTAAGLMLRSGVLMTSGSAASEERQEAPTPRATGVGR